MKPTTIAQIYNDHIHLCHYRVREVGANEDFLILWPTQFCKDRNDVKFAQPSWFAAWSLDKQLGAVNLNGLFANYIMLSTREESQVLSCMAEIDMKELLSKTYSHLGESYEDPASP